jgi:3-hydroxyacyl-[acyl-carrier-protein] dehydratase
VTVPAGNDAPCASDAARSASVEAVLDHHAIAALLPQHGPFLLVDRVIAIAEGHRLVGLKNVSLTDPYFRGHFPGNPIMPGVLICEALAQAAALLVRRSTAPVPSLVVVGLDRVRFRRPVVAADAIIVLRADDEASR